MKLQVKRTPCFRVLCCTQLWQSHEENKLYEKELILFSCFFDVLEL